MDCPIYALTYGQDEFEADSLSVPSDFEALISKLEQLGGSPLGQADAPASR